MELLGKNKCNHVVGDPAIAFELSTCPRCLSAGIYGDVSYDSSGKLNTISKSTQLHQQIEKILKENRRASGYGFDYTLLNGVIDNNRTLAVQREVVRTINYFINTVQETEKAEGYIYSSDEELAEIMSVKAYQDSTEPRKIIVIINLLTVSGRSITINTSLRR